MLPTDRIEGRSTGSPEQVLQWAKANGAQRVEDLAEYMEVIYETCAALGWNADVLVAQSAHETWNWTSGYWIESLNPAGIGVTDTEDLSMEYETGAEAAMAHIAHMWRYVVGERVNGYPPLAWIELDPRWAAVPQAWRGSVETIADLTGKWATDTRYAQKVAAKGTAIFGEGGNESFPPSEGATMIEKPRIFLSYGHRNTSGGNPVEQSLSDDWGRAYKAEFQSRGYDVWVEQENDGDSDPTFTNASLGTVARNISYEADNDPTLTAQGLPSAIMFDLHSNSGGRGAFSIVPDCIRADGKRLAAGFADGWAADDTWEYNSADRAIGQKAQDLIGQYTGLGSRTRPMEEGETGVGSQGYRLGMFGGTCRNRKYMVRLVIEHGAHGTPSELAIIQSPGFPGKIAEAAADAVDWYYGIHTTPQPDPLPEYALPVPIDGANRTHRLANGTALVACKQTLTSIGPSPRYRTANVSAKPIGPPVAVGESIELLYCLHADGQLWFIASDWARLPVTVFV